MNFLTDQLHVPFLDRIFEHLGVHKIDVSTFELDHICYRVESKARYLQLRNHLQDDHTLLAETNIAGRPISTFRLAKPLNYKGRSIAYFELPAPKLSSVYKEGYEHVEFVVDDRLDRFIEKHQHVKFDTSGIEKPTNPDIRLNLGSITVKFHRHSLAKIIEWEAT